MTLDEELATAVAKYLELSQHTTQAVETDSSLVRPIADLDKVFWKRVEATLDECVRRAPDHLQFGREERLAVDAGLLSPLLLREQASEITASLTQELHAAGEPRFYFLSEWLAQRFKNQVALEELRAPAAPPPEPPRTPESNELVRLRQARLKLYLAMAPFLESLPGYTEQAVSLVSSGKVDETLERLVGSSGPGASSHRDRLTELRTRILDRARSRCVHEKQLEMFDLMSQVDGLVESRLRAHAAPSVGGEALAEKDDRTAERRSFLLSEIKLVRSNIKLGVAGAGITRTHSVLLSPARRATKEELADLVRHIEMVDPMLPGRPNILIAPFTGSGFFEWDRDTVYVPLISTRNTEESIVNGIANYRIMIDNLHHGGRLKREYKRRRHVDDFRGQFLMDYRNWVLGIGRGFRGAMSKDAYEFFREVIGPSGDYMFAPADWIRLTPAEIHDFRKSLRAKMNRGEARYEDHLKMAYVYYRESLPDAALAQLATAVRMNPIDGRAMFALGWMYKRLGKDEKACTALKECLNIAPNTLWHIYASDELGKLT